MQSWTLSVNIRQATKEDGTNGYDIFDREPCEFKLESYNAKWSQRIIYTPVRQKPLPEASSLL